MYEKFKNYLSEERLNTYLILANNDKEKAIELYELNLKYSESFYSLLSYFEIILRNTFNERLKKEVGLNWLENNTILIGNNPIKSRETLNKIEEVKNSIRQAKYKKNIKNYKIKNEDIISNVSLGFWLKLLSANYENNIWQPYLKYIFKGYKRKDLYKIIDAIRIFRNRIFHYEPIIINNNLSKLYKQIVSLIALISDKETCQAIEAICNFNKINDEYKKNSGAPLN